MDSSYVVANAMAMCNGQRPEMLLYDSQLMRKHLAGCLEDKMMRHFTAKKRSVRKMTKKAELLDVYCKCRMPEEEGQRMISCNICKEWFHDECVKIPSEAWTNKDFIWNCSNCQ